MGSKKTSIRRRYISLNEVDSYLFTVEKYWPIENYIWSQETILDIVVMKDYNIISSIDMIKNKNNEFIKFIESKIL